MLLWMMSTLAVAPSLFLVSFAPEQVYAELQRLGTSGTFPLNGTQNSLEVRLTSNQSAVSVLAVMISLNSSASNAQLSANDVSVYDQLGNRYAINGGNTLRQFNNTNQMLDQEILPVSLPAGGSLGIEVQVVGSALEDILELTIVYVTSTDDDITIKFTPLVGMPFDVVENHESLEILGSVADEEPVKIENAFTDPEIHCETCTKVEIEPSASSHIDVAYLSNTTDLSSSDRMTFWAMGEGDVVFNIAGRNGSSQDVAYAKSVNVSLDNEWRRVEVNLSGINLDAITHLFGFSIDGRYGQTFYLKGISYS